jgi:hypothetical protein
LSFFDEDEQPSTEIRKPRTPRPPAARRPQRDPGRVPPDHHALVVRRRVLAGVGALVVLVLVVVVASAVSGSAKEEAETYAHNVSSLIKESDEVVSSPLFQAISAAGNQQRGSVESAINTYSSLAEEQERKVVALAVPESLESAQRYLELVFDLRAEGLRKIGSHISAALGGGSESASDYRYIAGAMQTFLTSDVVYSQRVAPLIEGALSTDGDSGVQVAHTQFLPNLGWLEPGTLTARVSGQAATAGSGAVTPGTHGSNLVGVDVSGKALVPGENNPVSGGPNPTFVVKVEDDGESRQSDVKVDVGVTSAGREYSAYNILRKVAPGQTADVEVPVEGVPLNTPTKVEVYVEPVPGETDLENNKAAYEATFS